MYARSIKWAPDTTMADAPAGWESRGKPPVLFRRFNFARYADTRAFLDAVAALSDEMGLHPQNINFGATYVNITLEAINGSVLGDAEVDFAARVNQLAPPGDA